MRPLRLLRVDGLRIRRQIKHLVSIIPVAERTGRCRPHSYVRKVATDNMGRLNGVIYFDSYKREILQKAKAVAVCANGAETPRLLLMSKSNLFPHSLANSSGWSGSTLCSRKKAPKSNRYVEE